MVAFQHHAQYLGLALWPVVIHRGFHRTLGLTNLACELRALGDQSLDIAVNRIDAAAHLTQRQGYWLGRIFFHSNHPDRQHTVDGFEIVDDLGTDILVGIDQVVRVVAA